MAITRRHLSQHRVALDHERALAIDALRLGRLIREPSTWPARWSEPAFGSEVERCRHHLARLKTRDALAAAYGHDVLPLGDVPGRAEMSPLRLAYALRWLEIQDGVIGPSWPAMVR